MRFNLPILTSIALILIGASIAPIGAETVRSAPSPVKLVQLAVIKEASRSGKTGIGGQLIRFQTPKKPLDAKTGDKLYLGDGLKVKRGEKVVIQCLVNKKIWTVPNNGSLWGVANGCPLPPDQIQLPPGQRNRNAY
jgi:hypothetical protein